MKNNPDQTTPKNPTIERFYANKLDQLLNPGKVLVIYGPRQVGKTTLVQNYLNSYSGKLFSSSGDDLDLKILLESQKFSRIIPFFQDYDLLFLDEAQRINQIGQSLKILVDQLPHLKIIATGSSSFGLANNIGEPLVGRQNIIRLFPISAIELRQQFGGMKIKQDLENLLVFGSYPEVITSSSFKKKTKYLRQLRDSYLLKDVLELQNIKNSRKIIDLLKLIAFQIGKEVSHQELGVQLGMSKNTVEKYLDLLEKSFILINVRGFSRNLRKEITKSSRYYFYDTGVRNVIIGNLNLASNRDDLPQLWENYLFLERMKRHAYLEKDVSYYFWRTYQQQEIDLVEENKGELNAYEFKWGSKNATAPMTWKKSYPKATFNTINQTNFLEFVSQFLR